MELPDFPDEEFIIEIMDVTKLPRRTVEKLFYAGAPWFLRYFEVIYRPMAPYTRINYVADRLQTDIETVQKFYQAYEKAWERRIKAEIV